MEVGGAGKEAGERPLVARVATSKSSCTRSHEAFTRLVRMPPLQRAEVAGGLAPSVTMVEFLWSIGLLGF